MFSVRNNKKNTQLSFECNYSERIWSAILEYALLEEIFWLGAGTILDAAEIQGSGLINTIRTAFAAVVYHFCI